MSWVNVMKLLLATLLLSMLLINRCDATEESNNEEIKNTSTASTPTNSNITKRERSVKISSESAKEIILINTDDTKNIWPSRKFTNGRIRDVKLPFVLQHQRRWPSSEECVKMCRKNNNNEFCRLKCSRDLKGIRSMKSNEEVRSMNGRKDISTENVNLVMQKNNKENKDELLETEESVHGVLILSNVNESNVNRSYNIIGIKAKETSNMINDNDKIEDIKRELKDGSSTTTTEATVVTKVNRRKYTRTSLLPTNHTRPTVYRGRVRYSPSSLRTSILEESEDPDLNNSDQRLGFTRKYSTTRRPTTSQQSTTTSRSKEEELEIMEVSVAKQSSTEKNIFWKARNIVAINNYMRKFNPNLSVMTTIAKSTKAITKPPTIKHETTHEENVTSTKAVPTKIIYSRPTKIPSLIINIPNDASPIFYTDNRDYQLSNGDFEGSTLPETTTLKVIVEEQASYYENTTKKEEEISSTTQSTTQLPSLTDSTMQTKSFRKNYTTIPRRSSKSSTTIAGKIDISSTISSYLSNASSKKHVTTTTTSNYVSSSTVVSLLTETLPTTTPMSVSRNAAKTSIPLYIEAVVPPSPKSFTTSTTTSQPHTLYEAISTTSKPEINDVFVEEQKASVTTYALGAALFLPLIVIVLLVIRHYAHKNERKSEDIENYSNDIQPISPVVTLDHGEENSSCFEGDDSIVSEAEFNRSKLKFKSLLGEGNFGQVWKAEIEDHSDHIGSIKIVAVKTERSNANNGQGGLKAECEIMRKLLPAHPNVVTLLGACVSKEPHMLIMSYEMRGKLLSLLRTARGVMNNGTLYHRPHNRETSMPLSPRRLTGFAHDIAKGMEYIAGKGVVHCDLAARNILVDHNGYCKICDFGMSIDLDKRNKENHIQIPRVSTYQNKFKFEMTARVFGGLKNYAISKARGGNCDTKNRPALPIRWMSPESLEFHIYSHETDVFAFGIVLWEIATLGITPYPTLTGREVIRGVIRDDIRPEIPPNCKQELSQIMSQCWVKDPRHRPTFSEIRKELARTLTHWQEETNTNHNDYLDVSGFSEDYENGMIYFNQRVSEFECEI